VRAINYLLCLLLQVGATLADQWPCQVVQPSPGAAPNSVIPLKPKGTTFTQTATYNSVGTWNLRYGACSPACVSVSVQGTGVLSDLPTFAVSTSPGTQSGTTNWFVVVTSWTFRNIGGVEIPSSNTTVQGLQPNLPSGPCQCQSSDCGNAVAQQYCTTTCAPPSYCAPTPYPGPDGCPSGETWQWIPYPVCQWQCEPDGSPIIVRLDPSVDWKYAFNPEKFALLDWNGDGRLYEVPVISNPQVFAWLLDRNCVEQSPVMSAKCLLGSATPQPPCPDGGRGCRNGFRALATEYDSNHDGVFGAGDTAYNDGQIVLWHQQDDWTPKAEQYESLPEAGVLSILLHDVKEEPYQSDGIRFHLKSMELTPQGQFPIYDVYLPLLPQAFASRCK
jgi:hypothetical protein